ncbi:MAG: hypothetical protein U0800_18620 [Isosphaeraceae bacterium]
MARAGGIDSAAGAAAGPVPLRLIVPSISDRPIVERSEGPGARAPRTRPRKLSADSEATRRRHSSHDSRCSWTDSAERPSSLPMPYEQRTRSLGWTCGASFIGRLPIPKA